MKHSRDYQAGEMPETDEYLPGLRPPLEAQLIDLADEAAYNTADLDDGFAAGLIRIDDARNAVPRLEPIFSKRRKASSPGRASECGLTKCCGR